MMPVGYSTTAVGVTAQDVLSYVNQHSPDLLAPAPGVLSGPVGKAKCAFNQPYCEGLRALADKFRHDSKRENLAKVLDRARRSILDENRELRSKKDFLSIKGVGPYVTRHLEDILDTMNGVPKETRTGKQNAKGKSSASSSIVKSGVSPIKPAEVPAKSIDRSKSLPVRSTAASKASLSSSTIVVGLDDDEQEDDSKSKREKKRMKKDESGAGSSLERSITLPLPSLTMLEKSSSQPPPTSSSTLQGSSCPLSQASSLTRSSSLLTGKGLVRTSSITTSNIDVPANASEASIVSSNVLRPSPTIQCVLLLDQREIGGVRDRHLFENKLRQMDILVEVRSLPLGDVTWIIRDLANGTEYICDTIIERKTADDLAISIKDGRYKEQQSRLLDSGLDRPIYLIEGNINRVTGIPVKTLETSILQSRMAGFLVHLTSSSDSTCEYLHRVHQSILQKFARGNYVRNEWTLWEAFVARSKIVVYKTVGEMFQAMLVQVPGCSAEKARAITDVYPTPNALFRAYQENKLPDANLEWKRREKLLQDITSGPSKRRLGPKLSSTLAQLFCLSDYKDGYAGDEKDDDDSSEYAV